MKYANERVQFNTPIAQFGAIRYKIAEMATSTYAGESVAYRNAKAVEEQIEARVAEGLSHQAVKIRRRICRVLLIVYIQVV